MAPHHTKGKKAGMIVKTVRKTGKTEYHESNYVSVQKVKELSTDGTHEIDTEYVSVSLADSGVEETKECIIIFNGDRSYLMENGRTVDVIMCGNN